MKLMILFTVIVLLFGAMAASAHAVPDWKDWTCRKCDQVQPAINKNTGECREFARCDVPKGWKRVKECPICIQVTQAAVNKKGECREFATPCNVPKGWKPVNHCPSEICIQVIQPAVNDKTGECTEFPTPCDVPNGWTPVSSC